MPNVEENPGELSLDDSKVSTNGNSLNDTLNNVYEDENEIWISPVSSFDSVDSDNDDCKKWKASPVRPADFVLTEWNGVKIGVKLCLGSPWS